MRIIFTSTVEVHDDNGDTIIFPRGSIIPGRAHSVKPHYYAYGMVQGRSYCFLIGREVRLLSPLEELALQGE